jgi:hypothetical protein
MAIPLVLVLWENANFGGCRRSLVSDTPDLGGQGFNDVTSSVGVHPGPDYFTYKNAHGGAEPTVTLYEDIGYGGAALELKTAFTRI